MKYRYLLSVVLLLIPSSLLGADREYTVPVHNTGTEYKAGDSLVKLNFVVPEQKLTAPTTVDQGDMVMVDITPITSPPQYLVSSSYKWKVLENGVEKTNIKVWPDGSSVVFGSGKQGGTVFTIVVSANYLYYGSENTVENGKTVSKPTIGQRSNLLIHTIKVNGGPAPGPIPPNPNPPGPLPGPNPIFPVGRYDLANKAYHAAMETVPANSRVKGAMVLSSAYSGIASQVAAGTLRDVKDLLLQSRTANRTGLSNAGVSAADWDGFMTRLQKETYTLYSSGKMSSVTDFADAWKEIAQGLQGVK